MITPEHIPFAVAIQEIKAKGPLSGFTLFQAFAVWLRKYIDPWVLVHKSSQEIKTYKNTYQGIAEQAELLDTTLQAAASDKEKLIEAYLEFISALIIDPFLYTRIQNPIFFFGHERAVKAGIYDKTLMRTSHSDITFRLYGEDNENPGNYIGNYIELNDLKPALHTFYSEVTKIGPDNSTVDAIIEKWIEDNKEETERSPAHLLVNNQRAIANTAAEQDIKMFILPAMGSLFLGGISSVICLCIAINDRAANETLNALPGDLLFPMWVGLVFGIVLGLTNMCHGAWVRRAPHYNTDDRAPPYLSVFIVAPMTAAIWASCIALIVAIEQDNFMILADTAWISAVIGAGVGLLCELHRYRHYTSLATEHPQTVQATPSMRQRIEMLPLVEYMRNASRS